MEELFVYRIHNNTLGTCLKISSSEAGFHVIKKWCEEQNFILTPEDEETLESMYQYYNDDDQDNVFTFGIGGFNEWDEE